MSDALCGPSNALQNLHKHASVDRTLQQDRLTSRQSPSRGFRLQTHNEGILDPEFAAFESNVAETPIPSLQHQTHLAAPSSHFSVHNQSENQQWSADFQRLQISASPLQMRQQPSLAAGPTSTVAQHGWHSEFIKQQQQQQQQPARLVQQHKPYAQGFQSSFAPQYPMSGAAMDSFPSIQEAPVGHLPPTEAFDESAFEAAFEQARADLASQTADKAQGQTQDVAEGEAQLDAVATPQTPESIKIGSDTIPQNNKDNMRAQLNDADDLAKTAGQLLESVSHDQSQKFRESNFLALMRRIRDREVHIEGDEFCETLQPLHPGGKYYPGDTTHKQRWKETDTISQDQYINASSDSGSNSRKIVQPEVALPAMASHETMTAANAPGLGEYHPLYEGWRFGDRWA